MSALADLPLDSLTGSTLVSLRGDSLAASFDAHATVDDGSCVHPGCTDSTLIGYSAMANADDGTCIVFLGALDILAGPALPATIKSHIPG